ncbi:Glutaredoxin 3 [Dinochytrium kinnereticum]|nr:Glutaredoxin 3 [Dinochytrium kinnereticum]
MSKSNTIVIESEQQLASFLKERRIVLLNFFATWAQQSKDMDEIEAEEFPEVSEKYEIAMVPTFLIIVDNKITQTIEGANAPLLTSSVEKISKMEAAPLLKPDTAATETPAYSAERLKALVSSHPVMIFIKGTPEQPRCGFSRQLLEILGEKGVEYGSFNILADENVRAGLKEYSNWPTYPQIYVNGELIGGLDILKELIASGEFENTFPKPENLESRLNRLGGAELTELSEQIVKLLQDQEVKFDTFDILEDEEVRAGLKELSNWPTYPQLYIKGELMGGLDIVKELIETGEFKTLC